MLLQHHLASTPSHYPNKCSLQAWNHLLGKNVRACNLLSFDQPTTSRIAPAGSPTSVGVPTWLLSPSCAWTNSSDSAMQPQHSCFDTLYIVSLSGLFCWVNWGIEELDLELVERVLTLLVKLTRIRSKKRTKWTFILSVAQNFELCALFYIWVWLKNMWLEFS